MLELSISTHERKELVASCRMLSKTIALDIYEEVYTVFSQPLCLNSGNTRVPLLSHTTPVIITEPLA